MDVSIQIRDELGFLLILRCNISSHIPNPFTHWNIRSPSPNPCHPPEPPPTWQKNSPAKEATTKAVSSCPSVTKSHSRSVGFKASKKRRSPSPVEAGWKKLLGREILRWVPKQKMSGQITPIFCFSNLQKQSCWYARCPSSLFLSCRWGGVESSETKQVHHSQWVKIYVCTILPPTKPPGRVHFAHQVLPHLCMDGQAILGVRFWHHQLGQLPRQPRLIQVTKNYGCLNREGLGPLLPWKTNPIRIEPWTVYLHSSNPWLFFNCSIQIHKILKGDLGKPARFRLLDSSKGPGLHSWNPTNQLARSWKFKRLQSQNFHKRKGHATSTIWGFYILLLFSWVYFLNTRIILVLRSPILCVYIQDVN